jgi:hypothetical protein
MSCAQLKIHIAAKQADLDKTRAAIKAHSEHMNYLISVFEQEIYELNVKLQLAEAEETFAEEDSKRLLGAWDLPNENTKDDPCYHCGRANHSCICASAPVNEQDVEDAFEAGAQMNAESHDIWASPPIRKIRTKLKWVCQLNAETYRIAVVTKGGILEVKRVTDGGGYCHDYKTCGCNPCAEIHLSGGRLPPWLKGVPLVKTFYETEAAWSESLPFGGTITVTEPKISDRALRVLCTKPLRYMTDGGRLEELEKRFPGAKMVLTTAREQLELKSMNSEATNQYHIYSPTTDEIRRTFSDFGSTKKPQLMAEWRGLYIDLSHLF